MLSVCRINMSDPKSLVMLTTEERKPHEYKTLEKKDRRKFKTKAVAKPEIYFLNRKKQLKEVFIRSIETVTLRSIKKKDTFLKILFHFFMKFGVTHPYARMYAPY